ncbi:MAG: arginine-tRNA-protein transferase [Raineya sp.]|nr:arginine-tRNA-protein transferase [Raineya sp.]MDW8295453.1 arginine-tRNA-protein transferase [Raineya sp.]
MLNEYFFQTNISGAELDELLSKGWRHFGEYFFRYESSFLETETGSLEQVQVIPLRICLEDFSFSKKQRKILKKNISFQVKRKLVEITNYKHELFAKHALRFSSNRPNSLFNFISTNPTFVPLPTYEIEVWDADKLIANSFVDITPQAFSSIYAMFDTDYAEYSLGIFTLLQEIEWAKSLQKKYLYLGYAYDKSSFYDYKKRFHALEKYNWQKDCWEKFQRE